MGLFILKVDINGTSRLSTSTIPCPKKSQHLLCVLLYLITSTTVLPAVKTSPIIKCDESVWSPLTARLRVKKWKTVRGVGRCPCLHLTSWTNWWEERLVMMPGYDPTLKVSVLWICILAWQMSSICRWQMLVLVVLNKNTSLKVKKKH